MQGHFLHIVLFAIFLMHVDRMLPLYVDKPNFFVDLEFIKEFDAPISSNHKSFFSLISALGYKRLGFGFRLLAFATNPPFNI